MRAAALFLLAGCDAVFGLSGHPGSIDAAVDGPPDDVAVELPDARCDIPVIAMPVVEDAEMIQANPTMGHGTESILNVGAAIGSVGIFKFDATGVDPLKVHHLTLRLPAVANAKECPSGGPATCTPCESLDHAGKFHVSFVRSDWMESTASWNDRQTGTPWSQPGAQGPIDRGTLSTVSIYAGAGNANLDVDPAELADWMTPGTNPRISVVVDSRDSAAIVIAQHAWSEQCTPTPSAPVLIADLCP